MAKYAISKADLAERIDPSVISKYLNVPQLDVGVDARKFAEVCRISPRLTIDGNPYLALTFKDINGIVIYGNIFNHTISSADMDRFSHCKKAYAELSFTTELYKGRMNLHIDTIKFLFDKDASSELADAFTPVYANTEEDYKAILEADFGDYSDIIHGVLEKGGFFQNLKNLYLEDYGTAKRGSITNIIRTMFEQIDMFSLNPQLAKATFLYAITVYANMRPIGSFGSKSEIPTIIQTFNNHMSQIKLTDTTSIAADFADEAERLLLAILGINVMQSVTSHTTLQIMKFQKSMAKLAVSSSTTVKDAQMLVEGQQVINR